MDLFEIGNSFSLHLIMAGSPVAQCPLRSFTTASARSSRPPEQKLGLAFLRNVKNVYTGTIHFTRNVKNVYTGTIHTAGS